MLAAFLEWFLWLAAFLYCLVKVYQKAENISVKVLAIIMMVLFTLFRSAKAVTFISLLSQLT
jgi:chitin synthase